MGGKNKPFCYSLQKEINKIQNFNVPRLILRSAFHIPSQKFIPSITANPPRQILSSSVPASQTFPAIVQNYLFILNDLVMQTFIQTIKGFVLISLLFTAACNEALKTDKNEADTLTTALSK